MAIILDPDVRRLVDERRSRGQSADIALFVEVLPVHGAGSRVLSATWSSRRRPAKAWIEQRVGDIVVHMDARIARYSRWHDIVLSGWRLGPLSRLVVEDEPLVMMRLLEWLRLHPGVESQPAA
ncbi:MAG TPA: hypothetical protein VFE42_00200 [Chloroflexota bacterium]|nr:hypothetical protein [Chloroflexota bacterium]